MLQRPGSSWGFGALLKNTSVVVLKEHTPPTIPARPEIRTHNLPLTSPTRYPLGHDCPLGLHYILQHLDIPGTYVRILFVDFSSVFNTIIPVTLQNKLTQLSVPTSVCQWITSFLTDRQQLVRVGNYHPAPVRSALELLRAAFSPHCSSPSIPTTAHLKTPLSSS